MTVNQRRLTSLFGKVYVWIQATQTGQWRLVSADTYLSRGEDQSQVIWL